METKFFAVVSDEMLVISVTSGQREKQSIQVNTCEQPELTGHSPIISEHIGTAFLADRKL